MIGSAAPLSHIALFGRSESLWSVAAMLGKSLPSSVRLTIIEEPDYNVHIPGALSLPWDGAFHRRLGLDAGDILSACDATLGLGIEFRDWQGDGTRNFIAPSGLLPRIEGVALHHLMLRAAIEYEGPERLGHLLRPFRLAERAALAGKFAFPPETEDSPAAILGPMLQIDSRDYAEFLKAAFSHPASDIVDGRLVALGEMQDDRTIDSVTLDNGLEIAADLMIDLSGTLSALLDEPRQREPIACLAPFDRIAGKEESAATPKPYGTVRALPGRIAIEAPLQTRMTSNFLFESGGAGARSAEWPDEGVSVSEFEGHFSAEPWAGNLICVGAASASLGPLFSADMLLLHEQALHLAALLPATAAMTVVAREFNARQRQSAVQIADFVSLPFTLNQRDDPAWRAAREASLPDMLTIRLEQFRSRGHFAAFDNELFDEQSWIDAMIGFGIVPERYHPAAAGIDLQNVRPALARLAQSFDQAIEAMLDHPDAMAQLAGMRDS